jgi:hypothetical protein
MRKNTIQAYKDFQNGIAIARCPAISTNKIAINSYKTPILSRGFPGEVILDVQKYSTTTTKQQNTLRGLLISDGYKMQDREGKKGKFEIYTKG